MKELEKCSKWTTLDLENLPLNDAGSTDYSQDFFGKKSHLTVSGQLEGEIAAHALSNIYTFGPTFRAENSHTSRHLSEFWMVEPEMAFCDLEMNMDVAESFLKQLFSDVLDWVSDDMAFFGNLIDKTYTRSNETSYRDPICPYNVYRGN